MMPATPIVGAVMDIVVWLLLSSTMPIPELTRVAATLTG
jgi:hypothetical protein